MKGIRFIPDGTTLRFMRISRFGYLASGILCALSLVLFLTVGLNVGVDFKGGTVITIRTEQPANLDQLRSTINGLGLGAAELQEFGTPNDVLIRIGVQDGGEEAQQAAIQKIKDALGSEVEYRRVEIVGPQVSSELVRNGALAVIVALLAILVYIWFRFEWQFGVAAILALVHDIIITLGVFSLLGLDFGLSEVAALLTLAGYSINDTVVVFDRIRENLRRYKKMALVELMNLSINETLSRTVLTATTTFLAVLALYVFGTEVIKGFSFAMLFGILIGTWSSIFVASPFLLWIGVKRDWSSEGAGAGAKAKA